MTRPSVVHTLTITCSCAEKITRKHFKIPPCALKVECPKCKQEVIVGLTDSEYINSLTDSHSNILLGMAWDRFQAEEGGWRE